MLTFFFKHSVLISIVLLLLVLSIMCQIIIGVLFQRMIRETDNMAATENRLLKQCKLKFSNCYQLNEGIVNVPVFVDKFLNRIRFAGISLVNIGHLSGQLVLLSVLTSGAGVCRGIIRGESLVELLPFYIVSLFGLYVYFSVSSMVDLKGRRNIVRTNLIDYLENHMMKHLDLLGEEKIQQIQRELTGPEMKQAVETKETAELGQAVAIKESMEGGRLWLHDVKRAEEAEGRKEGSRPKRASFSEKEQKELEALLKEFLA